MGKIWVSSVKELKKFIGYHDFQDDKSGGGKANGGPSKAEIAVAFIEELEKSRNKSKKHTLNELIVQKRQITSEDKNKKWKMYFTDWSIIK